MARAARPTRLGDKWRVRWLDHKGVRQSEVFDAYAEAEKALQAHQVEAERIRRGQQAPPPSDRTFNDLADYWLENRACEKRSEKDDVSIITRHLAPAFGTLLLRAIGVAEVDAFKKAKLQTLSPKTVANHVVLLGTMLRLATELGWLLSVPTIRKPRVDPDSEHEPPWLKTREEIDRFLNGAKSLAVPDDPQSELPFVLYSFAVFTGLRAGECAGLRWSDVDLVRRSVRVRRSYAGQTKTRSSQRHVPIVDALLPVLRTWKLRSDPNADDLVFTNRSGRMLEPCHRVFQETLHRALDAAGFARPRNGREKHVIHFHSLRHTFASHWRLNGGSLEDLISVLGHTTPTMTMHYAGLGAYHKPTHFGLFGTSNSEESRTRKLPTTNTA